MNIQLVQIHSTSAKFALSEYEFLLTTKVFTFTHLQTTVPVAMLWWRHHLSHSTPAIHLWLLNTKKVHQLRNFYIDFQPRCTLNRHFLAAFANNCTGRYAMVAPSPVSQHPCHPFVVGPLKVNYMTCNSINQALALAAKAFLYCFQLSIMFSK